MRQSRTLFFNVLTKKASETRFMVNKTMKTVQTIAKVLGLIERTCTMKEVKVTFAAAATTGMSK